jgi:hypothetical protein
MLPKASLLASNKIKPASPARIKLAAMVDRLIDGAERIS